MRQYLLLASLPALAALPYLVFAEDTPITAVATDTKPAIVTDDATGTVRIQVGDKNVVVIDASGLHVTGDITYSGMTSDIGNGDADAP